jgi:hypothetical protein
MAKATKKHATKRQPKQRRGHRTGSAQMMRVPSEFVAMLDDVITQQPKNFGTRADVMRGMVTLQAAGELI